MRSNRPQYTINLSYQLLSEPPRMNTTPSKDVETSYARNGVKLLGAAVIICTMRAIMAAA